MDDTGIIWLVDDNPAQRIFFDDSFATAMYFMPDVPKAVIYSGTDQTFPVETIRVPSSFKGYWAKPDAWAQSPFERTIFLDNDTFVLKDITSSLDSAKDFVGFAPGPIDQMDKYPDLTGIPESWKVCNSGVVYFTRSFAKEYADYFVRSREPFMGSLAGDQDVLSIYLKHTGQDFFSDILQVTTTPNVAKEVCVRAEVPWLPILGELSLFNFMTAGVMHYTYEKRLYRELFKRQFPIFG